MRFDQCIALQVFYKAVVDDTLEDLADRAQERDGPVILREVRVLAGLMEGQHGCLLPGAGKVSKAEARVE